MPAPLTSNFIVPFACLRTSMRIQQLGKHVLTQASCFSSLMCVMERDRPEIARRSDRGGPAKPNQGV